MIIDTTVYDLSMTLILARITSENSIVLSADGMALNQDDTVFSDSEQKVFNLIDEVHWSVAATGIYPGELKQLNLYLSENFRRISEVVSTYNMFEVAMLFSEQVKRWFEVNPRDDLRTDFVLVGFSKLENGYISPSIYSIYTDNNLIPKLCVMGIAVGNINEKFKSRFNNMPKSTEAYIKDSHSLIEDVSLEEPSVGGKITTVIIKGDMSKKLFKQLIKKASQPVPKEQDK